MYRIPQQVDLAPDLIGPNEMLVSERLFEDESKEYPSTYQIFDKKTGSLKDIDLQQLYESASRGFLHNSN